MGELLKTTSGIALNPYYIEDLSISVYSLEELSYCIYQNAYLAGGGLPEGTYVATTRIEHGGASVTFIRTGTQNIRPSSQNERQQKR